MYVIQARNVNEAYHLGLRTIRAVGVRRDSRAGEVYVLDAPLTTVYKRPMERVLFEPKRNANPFFHLFEALWMLSGSRDARWLDRFVKDFSSRFAEENGEQHGAYGYRWRHHFDVDGGGKPDLPDQIETVVRLLKQNPDDRRVVLTMWDPVADLAMSKRDIPCNTHIYLRVRGLSTSEKHARLASMGVSTDPAQRNLDGSDYHIMNAVDDESALDITVCCRSNDAIWGAYGANAVHFSVLQEYLAARLGAQIGIYYQVSNNFHAYATELEKVGEPEAGLLWYAALTQPQLMVTQPDRFDADLVNFMEWTADYEHGDAPFGYSNLWFSNTAEPLFAAHERWRAGERQHALEIVNDPVFDMAPDWRLAATNWMNRRMGKPSGG